MNGATLTMRPSQGLISADSGKPTGAETPADALEVIQRMSTSDGERQESYECPTCGLSCETSRSMKAHHTRQHGEGITDDYAAKPWQDPDTLNRLYHGEGMTQAEIAARFNVTRPCIGKWLRKHDIETYDPNAPGERVGLTCEWCGDDFETHPCEADAKYCSASCRSTAVSTEMWESRERPDEPAQLYYGPNWEDRRDAVRKRDGHQCRACGRPESEMDRELQVHHIRPFRTFEDRERANRMNNLVALCVACHSRWEGIPLCPQ